MNVLTRFAAMQRCIMNKSIYRLYPDAWIENLHYTRLKEGCCIRCGRDMAHGEMYPTDRLTPRAICPSCWTIMTVGLTTDCWICGDPLEKSRSVNQKNYPHDLHYRIHDGKCCDLFSLASAKVLGQKTGILEDEDNDNSFSSVFPGRIELPPPKEMPEVPSFSGWDKVEELVPRRHNGKKVIHITK